ncbi:HipA domain-containing protein [Sphaerotilus mobilis]|uniref:Serine/threonine-protein kinase HipA n=1 Tax=Sphaerotilus mobilis TaxID=47994 RepID=A0A4Q7LTX7_9BURK|nr:HipA domain-containing protein [Sphaerotilus mobilis]RZS58214.1 serine/threonine-protein kinase HipA [Sphaerotilus mobilis]
MPRTLQVTINRRPVGELHEADDLWRFAYDPLWQAATDGFDLSPALPRAQSLHVDGATRRPVQWYFDNLLPEEALRGVIAVESGLDADDAFALLAQLGAESAGSLVLQATADAPEPPAGLRALIEADLSRRIAQLPRASLSREAPKRMSLAGAQHKMLLVHQGGLWFEPLPGTPSTHILKPNHPGDDYPASVINEVATMRLAREVGLDVPRVAQARVPEAVYLIERFDRAVSAGDGRVERLHLIDACQLLDKSRLYKYSAAHVATLAEAVGRCRQKAAARLGLFRWLVFNLLVGNGDNHLKNISFRVDAGGIRLAPAYDLLSTAVYDTRALADERARWPATALAMPVGQATRFATVRRSDLIEAADTLGLSTATAQRETDRLIAAVRQRIGPLHAAIETESAALCAASRDPSRARLTLACEQRLLGAMRHVVVAEMVQRLG